MSKAVRFDTTVYFDDNDSGILCINKRRQKSVHRWKASNISFGNCNIPLVKRWTWESEETPLSNGMNRSAPSLPRRRFFKTPVGDREDSNNQEYKNFGNPPPRLPKRQDSEEWDALVDQIDNPEKLCDRKKFKMSWSSNEQKPLGFYGHNSASNQGNEWVLIRPSGLTA